MYDNETIDHADAGTLRLMVRNLQAGGKQAVPSGFRVMKPTSSVRRGGRWEIYAPSGSGGIVHEDDVTDWVVRNLLDALAAAPQADQAVEPVMPECAHGACPICEAGSPIEYHRAGSNTVRCDCCNFKVCQSEVGMGDAQERWNKLSAAVHKTAPPAPDVSGLVGALQKEATSLCDAVENINDLPPAGYALQAGRAVNRVRDAVAALAAHQQTAPTAAPAVAGLVEALEQIADGRHSGIYQIEQQRRVARVALAEFAAHQSGGAK